MTGGTLSYSGTHDFSDNLIRLWPYDDTTNPGGVYTLAVCNLADRDTSAANAPGVNASDCKYDNFKVDNGSSSGATAPVITKDAAGAYKTTFDWGITKDVDHSRLEQSGTDATFNYAVSVSHDAGTVGDVRVTGSIDVFNPNGSPVTHATVTDQLSDGTVCTVTGGSDTSLQPGDNTFAYTCHLSSLPQGELDNTATVNWGAQGLSTKGPLAAGSASVTFTNVAFDETKVDDCSAVTDTVAGELGTVCSTDPSPTSFNYPRPVTGTPGTCTSYDNTATFTTNTTGATDSASQQAVLCVGADLTVTKTANRAFKRTYNWGITKQVDKTSITTRADQAVFNYIVTANQTGFTDSDWTVTGDITVTNPNDWESVTLTGVSDSIGNGGSCTVTSGDPAATLAAGASTTLGYACTYATKPYPASFVNTATATWDAVAAHTPNGSASGTASGAFGDPTSTVNKTITVSDTFQGTTTPLGTVTGTDATPYASGTFSYSRTVVVPATSCTTYSNTATIVETGQSASASVTACRAMNTDGYTIGFWTNKNGQKTITNGYSAMCATLASYPTVMTGRPAPCTSSTLPTYVTSVIAGANASGDGAPMFKAQFLATTLSATNTPSLGTTGIHVDPAIFGTSCKTVNQLLAFGNANYTSLSLDKTTFMAVKSVYDDINNNRAYTCNP